ncbi:MAG: hypothetical protein AB7J40_02545 [Candidatus Altimarinota bacterium]
MSPHLILILMLSSCALLLMLFFAVRKRAQKVKNPAPLPVSPNPMPDLNSLDFSSLKDISTPPPAQPSPTEHHSDLLELVSRYRFFQGKNFQLFKDFLEQKNWARIEQLISEKFQAQGKKNSAELAQEVTLKLQTTMHSQL